MHLKQFCLDNDFRTTDEWHSYFSSNRNVMQAVACDGGRNLTDDEKLRITASIQEFQLGESSEGRHLNEFARRYSEKNGDPLYYETIKFFIREEQRHSRILGRFMEREGIPKLGRSLVDSVFRHLRRYAGLELSITVLLMAEIISLVYYRALRAATSSEVLREICTELLKDESAHLRFHCERLAFIRRENGFLMGSSLGFFQVILLSGTCVVVWLNHWEVLCARHSLGGYWKTVWRIYGGALQRMRTKKNQVKRQENNQFATSSIR